MTQDKNNSSSNKKSARTIWTLDLNQSPFVMTFVRILMFYDHYRTIVDRRWRQHSKMTKHTDVADRLCESIRCMNVKWTFSMPPSLDVCCSLPLTSSLVRFVYFVWIIFYKRVYKRCKWDVNTWNWRNQLIISHCVSVWIWFWLSHALTWKWMCIYEYASCVDIKSILCIAFTKPNQTCT